MQPVVHIQPAEAWWYHKREKSRLEEELVEIASNEEIKTSVYITDENGSPYIYVYRDDKKIFQSACLTQYETERNLRVVYEQYLVQTGEVRNSSNEHKKSQKSTHDVDDDADDDDDTPPCPDIDSMSDTEFNDYCEERENAILAAVCSLIEALTEDEEGAILEPDGVAEDDINTIVDKIVGYLAINCGFRIRRPMEVMLEDEGSALRTEYPYEEFDFDDGELILK